MSELSSALVSLCENENETENSCLVRIGDLKESGQLDCTWGDVCALLNSKYRKNIDPLEESTWRKRYRRIKGAFKNPPKREIITEDYITSAEKDMLIELEKQRSSLSRERVAFKRSIRDESKISDTIRMLKESIKTVEVPAFKSKEQTNSSKAIYVMLSDVHYGVDFNNAIGKYNTKIAGERL